MRKVIGSIMMIGFLIFGLSSCREDKKEMEEKNGIERAGEEIGDGVDRAGEEVKGAYKDVKEEVDGQTDDN